MTPKKKYYAVAKGRKSGIYTSWPEAAAQVQGYAGAKYKGFASRAEAASWMQNPVYGSAPPRAAAAVREPARAYGGETGSKKDAVTIYTDGGSRNNPGPGGYGVVQVYDGKRRERSGGYRLTTNNRMELMGCIVALRELEYRDKPVLLYSDSSYVVNGISKGWARNWQRRGWMKADKTPAMNPDLWQELLALTDELDVTFQWVRGHAGDPLNERCDQLAVAASHGEDLPEDEGYMG